MIRVKNIVALLMITGLVFGCSKEDDGASTAKSDAAPLTGIVAEAAAKAQVESKNIDANEKLKAAMKQPLSEYVEVDSDEQVVYMYYAASKLPVNYEIIAEKISKDYRNTSDGFKKKEIQTALKPLIDEKISALKANPYGWIEVRSADIQAYDFDKGGFVVDLFANNQNFSWNYSNFKLTFKNNEQVKFATIKDEAAAREIESMRTNYNAQPRLKVYFYNGDANLNDTAAEVSVTRVEFTDKSGRVIASYGPNLNQKAKADAEAYSAASDVAADAAAAAAAY